MVRTGLDTVTASNTFGVVGMAKNIHIHLAYFATQTAGGTFGGIYGEAVHGDGIQQGIKCPQRTDPFAKGAVKEN